MESEERVRNFSNDELFRRYSRSSPGAIGNEVYAAEIKRREFLAGQANLVTAKRIGRLTFWLVLVGVLQAIATGCPYLAWWVFAQLPVIRLALN